MSKEKMESNDTLQELGTSGYEMTKGEPDIRGWKVISALNQEIGRVKELLFDVQALKVRYVIVALDGRPMNLLSRDIILPVGLAELDEKDNVVLVPDVTAGHFAALPEYRRGEITYQTESQVLKVFAPQNDIPAEKLADLKGHDEREREAFYNNDHFDDDRMFRRRGNGNSREAGREDNRDAEKTGRYVRPQDEMRQANDNRPVEDDVMYIPDEKDPTLLRKVRVIREDKKS